MSGWHKLDQFFVRFWGTRPHPGTRTDPGRVLVSEPSLIKGTGVCWLVYPIRDALLRELLHSTVTLKCTIVEVEHNVHFWSSICCLVYLCAGSICH